MLPLLSHGRSAALAAWLIVLTTRTIAAQEAIERVSNASIVVTFEPQSIEQSRMVSAIKAHMSGLPVQVVVQPVERARSLDQQIDRSGALALSLGALGTFSIELGAQRELLLFFTEPKGSATLVRRLPPSPEGTRVALEQAAIVVRSLVEALLEGRRIGMSEGETSENAGTRAASATKKRSARQKPALARKSENAGSSEPRTDADPTAEPDTPDIYEDLAADSDSGGMPRRARKLAISGGYVGTHFAASTGWQSGFALGARWTVIPHLFAGIRYTFFSRIEAGAAPARLSVARRPIELVAGYLGTSSFAPSAELGLSADLTRRDTLSTAPGYAPLPSVTRWMVALGARAGVTWSATSVLQVSLRGGADVLLTRYSYAVAGEDPAITPSAVRPRLELHLDLGVW